MTGTPVEVPQPRTVILKFLFDTGQYHLIQQRQHNFMVTGYGISVAPILGWAGSHVFFRTVMLDHVHIYSGKTMRVVPKVSSDRQSF